MVYHVTLLFPSLMTLLKTFMQKMGDMLEAAAETAIPSSPVNRRRSSRVGLTWDAWDATSLAEFMVEEVIFGVAQ